MGRQGETEKSPAKNALYVYRQAFEQLNDSDTADEFANAMEFYMRRIDIPPINSPGAYAPRSQDSASVPSAAESSRSIFADVDEGD